MVVLALSLAACSGPTDSEPAPTTATAIVSETTTVAPIDQTSADEAALDVNDEGTTSVDQAELEAQVTAIPASTLTTEEIDGLLFMREEEKLAHDVYVALADMWQTRVFSNVAGAELTHTDAVKAVLDRYDLLDPALENPPGVFANADLQNLYDELVDRGSESLVEALKVGALIEDLDIFDLRSFQTDTPDIALLYANLEKGSRNHLRAFISKLEGQGATYLPEFLTPEEFEAIISTPTERGRG